MDWSIFLFAMKWIFLGLVYLVLLLLLIAVQREMRLRMPTPSASAATSAVTFGRLRVIMPGSDPRLRPGSLLALQPETTVGSQSGNDLVLHDRYISARHARLRWDGVSWWVDDLGSTNGTFVNHQRVNPGAPSALPSGAMLEMGDMSFEMVE